VPAAQHIVGFGLGDGSVFNEVFALDRSDANQGGLAGDELLLRYPRIGRPDPLCRFHRQAVVDAAGVATVVERQAADAMLAEGPLRAYSVSVEYLFTLR